MNYMNGVSEAILRESFGDEIVEEALEALEQGKLVARQFVPPATIGASWEFKSTTTQVEAFVEGDTLMMQCTCRKFGSGTACLHVTALLLAWASQSYTFQGFSEEPDIPQPLPRLPQRIEAQLVSYDPAEDYRKILIMQNLAEVREIARRRGVPISGLRKEPIVEALAQTLAKPEKFQSDWPSLSSQARLLAGLIPFSGQPLHTNNLKAIAQAAGLLGELAFDEALLELKMFGLLTWDTNGFINCIRLLLLWLPPDADFLSIQALDPTGKRVQTAPPPRDFYQLLVRLLMVMQAAGSSYRVNLDERERVLQKKLPFLQGWPIGLAELENLMRPGISSLPMGQNTLKVRPQPPLLSGEGRLKLASTLKITPDQLEFALRILSAIGLMQLVPGKPVQVVPNDILLVMQSEPLRVVKEVFVRYPLVSDWSEIDLLLARPKVFSMVISDKTRVRYSRFLDNLSTLRQYLLLLIRRMPVGRWVDLDSLLAQGVRLIDSTLLRSILETGRLEIDGQQVKSEREDVSKQFLRAFAGAVLGGPLYWQGAVDLAWDGERLAGFRLTPLGGSLMVQQINYEMPAPIKSQPEIAFLADGSIQLNLETVESQTLQLLSLFGDIKINPHNDMVYQWSLAGAGHAFEAGWNAEQIIERLSQASRSTLPDKLTEQLRRWWSDFGSVQIYQDVAMIELGDDYAFNELLAATSLSRYLLYRFSPRVLAIRPEGVPVLRDELVKKGYTPRMVA